MIQQYKYTIQFMSVESCTTLCVLCGGCLFACQDRHATRVNLIQFCFKVTYLLLFLTLYAVIVFFLGWQFVASHDVETHISLLSVKRGKICKTLLPFVKVCGS